MKFNAKKAVLLCLCGILISCAANQRLATPSGRPEVTVNATVSRAQNVTIDVMASNGYALTSQTSNALVFEKEMPPDQAMVFLIGVGNPYSSQPKSIVRFVFTSSGGQVRIYGTVQASTQGPFGQTTNLDITSGKSAQALQTSLEALKQRIGQR